MLRRTTALLLLTLFLLTLVGYYPVCMVQQWHIRKEIKRRIKQGVPAEELHGFSFSPEEVAGLDWQKEGKEFRFQGQFYDIVRTDTVEGYIHYQCINDQQETTLFAHLDTLIGSQMDVLGISLQKTVKKLWQGWLFLLNRPASQAVVYPCNGVQGLYFSYTDGCSAGFVSIVSPPPRQVHS